MKRYTGKFINLAGQSCQVNIYDDNYSGDAVELYMSTTPITISESAQDLVTEPIMASSAVITFINDAALEGFTVSDEMQCAVEVLADGALVWHGYLNPDVRDDLLPSITGEVTLNATSTLGLTSTRKIDAEGEPLCSIASYIAEALQDCGNVLTDICLPSVAKVTSDAGYNSIWTLRAQRDNFYSVEEITSTNDEQYDEQSWEEVLSNFMTLFGLTMMEDYASGCIMLLSRDTDATYCRMTLDDFAAGTGAESYALPESTDMASLPMWGTSHSTSSYRPYSSVKITSEVNTVETTLFSLDNVVGAPAIDGSGYRVGMDDIGDATNPSNESVLELCSGGIRQINSNICVYKPSEEEKTYQRIETFDGLSRSDIISLQIIGLVGYTDIWLLGAVPIKGGIGWRNSHTSNLSFTPDFDPMLFVGTDIAWPKSSVKQDRLSLAEQTELIRLKNEYYYGTNWAMSIDIELQSWYTNYQYYDFIDPIELILRVGNAYWNGSEWQSEETSFTPETTKEGGLRSTEDECQDSNYYTGLKGILIPHTESDVAQGDTCIGLMLSVRLHKDWDYNIPAFIIKKFDVKISPDLRSADRDAITGEPKKEYVYNKKYKENGNNPLEIDLNVQGYHGELLAKSCLVDTQGEAIAYLYYGKTEDIPGLGTTPVTSAPEEWLADHLKAIYCRSRKRYKLTVEGIIDYKTNTRYSYGDITYTTVARSLDLYNNTTTITLEQATQNA